MSPNLLFSVLTIRFLGIMNGIWPTTNAHQTTNLVCNCGEYPNVQSWIIPISPKKGHSVLVYMLHGGFSISSGQQLCAEYRNCRKCYPKGGRKCKSCPAQKYGRFCEKDCDCQNGASCTRNGKCLCRRGFEGPKCESLRCGQPYSGRSPLIRYGNVTKIAQWPWQAALFIRNDENRTVLDFLCGGSLLNDQWVMTAAHCLTDSPPSDVTPKEELRVYLGKYYREISKDDKYVQKRKIEEIYVYPRYDNKTLDGDIALMKLTKPVRMTKRIQPVCLPTLETSERNIVDGKKGVVTGWGENKYSKLTETLEEAVIPVITGNDCKKGYEVSENMFCAGYVFPNASDSAYGDSGGPVVFLDPLSHTKRWVVEGIVSWGNPVVTENGIDIEIGVYTKVSKYLEWIQSYIGKPRTSVMKANL